MAKNDMEESKIFAFLGVFLTIIGFLVVLLAKRENKYAMHYAKQGLVLFVAYVIAMVANMVLVFIPIIGWFLMLVIWVGLLILWIMGIVYAFSGEMKEIPLIGGFAKKINL